jgi:hypothetical protein
MTGVELIAAERFRQVDAEGWTPEHDDTHTAAELARAAISYIAVAVSLKRTKAGWMWPWDAADFKREEDPVRNLVKAGALIAAEIDRLERARS